ncbi:hypothetical protein ONZ51_g9517 [Trametes cubensis]|uniref:Zinc finger C3HC4 RING-type domain-containing protein n=1 Tax=Trametes cubensis TaxID=1111947 RepID=A0AAD7X886_9APHY|nr:hypothetical protein ONZ51_g9517 [Trametes cubensis]
MSSYTYVDIPNANLTCYHTFCYDCISQAIAINSHCPIDRTPLSIQDLSPADPVIRNLVDELLVKCPHESIGSKETSTEPEQPTDEQRTGRESRGENARTDTPRQECSSSCATLAAENAVLRLRLSALENVVHSLRSEMFAVKHALGPWYRPEVQYQLHQQGDPQHSPHAAPLQSPEYSSPEDGATYPPIPVPDSAPSAPIGDPADIASYFPPPDDQANTDVRTRPRRARVNTDTRQPHSATSTPPNAHTTLYASMPGAYPHGALYTQSGAYTTPGLAPGASYTPGSSLPTSTPATVSIPPLDPTTPLPDTLASLHSSLVTLAGALGALGAARGSESLRTTEELRGLRGAIHALRMQVHDILTSRTHLANPGPTTAVGGGKRGFGCIRGTARRHGYTLLAWLRSSSIRTFAHIPSSVPPTSPRHAPCAPYEYHQALSCHESMILGMADLQHMSEGRTRFVRLTYVLLDGRRAVSPEL